MNKKVIAVVIVVLALFLGLSSMFTVKENEYACTVRFS